MAVSTLVEYKTRKETSLFAVLPSRPSGVSWQPEATGPTSFSDSSNWSDNAL